MPRVQFSLESAVVNSFRVSQLSAAFDVPPQDRTRVEIDVPFPIEERQWNVGLIVGASGSGKTSVVRRVFGEPSVLTWHGASVVDDFGERFSFSEIVDVCRAVGFNTIPSWMRPFHLLSNGEKFRVEIARTLLETPSDATIVLDEFTSVVDRQVARITSNAVQKFARKHQRQLVAVTCHYDVEDWLQPDWVLDMSSRDFRWRSLQRRPALDVEICPVSYDAWATFAPFHYMSRDLNRSARCYGLYVGDVLAAFAGVLYRPHPRVRNVYGLSRLVTLPDWQGIGLAMFLACTLGNAHATLGNRFRTYPAHPSLVQSFAHSKEFRMTQALTLTANSSRRTGAGTTLPPDAFGGRHCARFEYVGQSRMTFDDAHVLLGM